VRKIIIAAILAAVLAPGASAATEPYFGLIGSKRMGIQTEQLALLPVAGGSAAGTMNVVLVGHSTRSWGLIPDSWQNWLAPEDWGLLVGCGGSSANLLCDFSIAANVSPQIATLILGKAGTQSSPIAKAISQTMTSGLALSGNMSLGFAMSYGLGGGIIKDGYFQSIPAMFPYRGLGPNLLHASYIGVGTTLKFL
jgi:hypothetical protein